MAPSGLPKLLTKLALVGLAFYATARFGLQIASPTPVWAPAGIALAALLRWGPAVLLATTAAHVAANLAEGFPPSLALAAAAAGGLEAAGAAWLLHRVGFDRSFGSLRDLVAFASVGPVGAAGAGALIGASALVGTGQLPANEWLVALERWWIGDGIGVLVVAPALLLADRLRAAFDGWKRAADSGLMVSALLVSAAAAFAPWPSHDPSNYPLGFLTFPALAWIAYRRGAAGAAAANLAVSLVAVGATLHGSGPFARASTTESMLLLSTFLSVAAFASLALAVIVAARDRTERELRDAAEALRAIGEATQAGYWIWRPESRLHLGSPRQRWLHGVGDRENPIPEDDLIATIHADDRDRIVREFIAARKRKERIETAYRVMLPDGAIRWLDVRGVPLPIDPKDPEGPFQMVGVHVDVTARRQLEERLRRSERLASLGTFAAGLAHELNNPLGTIQLAADAARADLGDPNAVARALGDIDENARRCARIVKGVLRFAKEETAERGALDLEPCLRHALDLARSFCVARGVSLEGTSEPLSLRVLANATEVEQLILNLVHNASQACEPGGRVRVHAEAAGDAVALTVSDDGCGMTETELERAFDPFYTTRPQQGGSGLGLSICHGIVEAHGGRIEIESAPGTGTRVRVLLPGAGTHGSIEAEVDHGTGAGG